MADRDLPRLDLKERLTDPRIKGATGTARAKAASMMKAATMALPMMGEGLGSAELAVLLPLLSEAVVAGGILSTEGDRGRGPPMHIKTEKGGQKPPTDTLPPVKIGKPFEGFGKAPADSEIFRNVLDAVKPLMSHNESGTDADEIDKDIEWKKKQSDKYWDRTKPVPKPVPKPMPDKPIRNPKHWSEVD